MLVGFTAWTVATVSVWWVPAYLALMVLIFVTPRGRCPWEGTLEADSLFIAADTRES